MKKQQKHYSPEEKIAILAQSAGEGADLEPVTTYACSPRSSNWLGGSRRFHTERDRKLEQARKQRQMRRRAAA